MQKDVPHNNRKNIGLHAVFQYVFPIMDFNKTVSLEYVSYSFEPPKYSIKECRERGLSYEAPLKVVVRLVFFEVNVDKDGNETRTVSSIKEQEVYLGNLPLMADTGSFIYNGTERVIVSQLHRSPGIIFEHKWQYYKLSIFNNFFFNYNYFFKNTLSKIPKVRPWY